jgi:hypothetical protein
MCLYDDTFRFARHVRMQKKNHVSIQCSMCVMSFKYVYQAFVCFESKDWFLKTLRAHMHLTTHTHTHTHAHIYIYMYMYICIDTYIHTRIYVCIYIYICIYVL